MVGRRRIAVLVSGFGSNLQAIIDAASAGSLDVEVVLVAADRADAFGLQRAQRAGIATLLAVPTREQRRDPAARAQYDAQLATQVAEVAPDLVVLAGWMRVLSPSFLDRFDGRVINLHPALPGTFAGTHAIERAFDAARAGTIDRTGVMVHRVVPEVDAGPVIVSEEVAIAGDDTLETLTARIHQVEQRLLVEAIRRTGGTMATLRRALISVHDKSGLSELGRALIERGFQLVASGGTAQALRAADLAVSPVEQVTGSPQLLDGRVKTLHPAIFGGILARRTPEHLAELASHQLAPIDVVVCNLYPFVETVQRGASESDTVEQIDIGGVSLLRAAAKNFESVAVVCETADYSQLIELLDGPADALARRRQLALKAFRHTAAYDAAISDWFGRGAASAELPATLHLAGERRQALRYGENPHQRAALYGVAGAPFPFEQHQGKELSYNNLVDLDAASAMVAEFALPTVAIVKHTNPCGLASGDDAVSAFRRALECDPVSAFGSVIAVNRPVNMELLEAIGTLFVEVMVAPAFDEAALDWLARKKKNCRVLSGQPAATGQLQIRSLLGGLLVQTADDRSVDRTAWRIVSKRQPSDAELRELEFAWRAVKHVKSNAIVFARDQSLVGVGAGQMNRVDSVFLAARRAGEKARGAVLGSDAFFPFADGVELAAQAGVTAGIEPGGSIRDDEVIAAVDRLGLAMVFTGERHFRH